MNNTDLVEYNYAWSEIIIVFLSFCILYLCFIIIIYYVCCRNYVSRHSKIQLSGHLFVFVRLLMIGVTSGSNALEMFLWFGSRCFPQRTKTETFEEKKMLRLWKIKNNLLSYIFKGHFYLLYKNKTSFKIKKWSFSSNNCSFLLVTCKIKHSYIHSACSPHFVAQIWVNSPFNTNVWLLRLM